MPVNRVRSLPRPRDRPYPLLPCQRAPLNPPRRRQELDVYTRTQITTLKSNGFSYREIASKYPTIPIGTIKSTVNREKTRIKNETSPRSGCPRKLNENDKERLLDAIDENPRVKSDDLLAEVDLKVCRQSIWRLLKECNLRKWRVLKRPELTDEHARKRLVWARANQHRTPDMWRLVFWSDESTVERGKGARQEWTFTRPKDQIAAQDVQTYSYKGVKQMFWAVFSGSGRRTGLIPLFPIDEIGGGINRWVILETYQRVLPTLINGVEGAIFMQDNAPVHTAYVVRDWLNEQEFEVMVWPPHSPDLNPIENLWALLKAKINELRKDLNTLPDNDETLEILVETAQQAWSEIDLSILGNLADTMPHRVQDILDNNGWYTSY